MKQRGKRERRMCVLFPDRGIFEQRTEEVKQQAGLWEERIPDRETSK